MELSQVLQQPEGFTPPAVTVRIKKVHPRKSGDNSNGPWSFQNIEVEGGRLKLKNLPEFPKAREGQTVRLTANQSKQHGLTGIKVNHEEYNGNTYHQLVITNSAKWEWGAPATNGSAAPHSSPAASELSTEAYTAHLLSCAALTNQITTVLGVSDEQAIQSCFATVCIDTKNRGIVLPKTLPALTAEKAGQGDPYEDAPPPNFGEPPSGELTEEDIPF
jgi:hypothetical protein